VTADDRVTECDAIAEEREQRDLLLRRAQFVAQARRDSVREHRATIADLVIVLALSPFTRATEAPPGQMGRPIGPSDDQLPPPRTARRAAEIPRQPRLARNPEVAARAARHAQARWGR
jgi:hypothetical protein